MLRYLFPIAAACGLWGLPASLAIAAEQGALKHPALKHDLDPALRPRWEKDAAPALALSPPELAARVPRQTPFITCDCPACGARTYHRGCDMVTWEFNSPDRMTCRACKTSFPNEKFPCNKRISKLNTRGEPIEVAFYLDPQGKPFYLDAAIASMRNEELVKQIAAMAKLYAVTKNEACAERIVALLAKYAEYFPHYLVKDFRTAIDDPPGPRGAQRSWYEYVSTGGPWLVNGKPRGSKPSEPQASEQQTTTPYGWTQSRWGWGRWDGETPVELLKAYDLIYDSPAFAKLSAELNRDVREHIEEQLFRNAAAFLLEYPFWYHVHSNAASQTTHLVQVGMVLNEPSYVAFARRWSERVLEDYVFSRDGAYGESPGYFYVFYATHAGSFTALKEAAEYFGGAGSAAEKAQAQRAVDFLDKSIAAIESVRFPNGSSLPISDNRHDEFVDPPYRPGVRGEVRANSTDVLLPGYGHALLGAGAGDRQVQAHLHFSPFKEAIHTHRDGLSLMLWAFGAELYTDIGYNRTKYRMYASTTLSHNTVVVDRKPQNGDTTKGRLRAFESSGHGWSFVQVEDAHAYGPPLSRYRRSLLLNARDLDAPYLIDVFEVRGGRMHDYALHGPTVFDSTAEVDVPLTALSDERPLLLPDEATAFNLAEHPYGLFSQVQAATPTQDFAITYRLVKPYELPQFATNPRYPHGTSFHYAVDPQNYADHGEIGVQSRFVGFLKQGDAGSWRVLLGQTPSLLRGGLIGSPLTEKLQRPSLLVRHEGGDSLASTYVVVHEPYYRAPKITAVRRLPTEQPDTVALEIERAGRVDAVLLALDGDDVTAAAADPIRMQGRLAVIERTAGKPAEAWLVGGKSLRQGEFVLTNDTAGYTGTIESVSSVWNGDAENAFVSIATLPEGEQLAGRWMIVHHGDDAVDEGYQIAKIEKRGAKYIVHLTDDPGLRINGTTTEEIFFPRRRWTGANRFTILTQASTTQSH